MIKSNKKLFTIIGLIIIFPIFLLISPQKTNAMVPTTDITTQGLITEGNLTLGDIAWNTSALVQKEVGPGGVPSPTGWDAIAYTIAKTLLHSLVQSTIQWIRSGFKGDPLFITDMNKYLLDAADQGTGRFFKEFLSPAVQNAICRPFRLQVLLGVPRGRSYNQRFQCTLGTVITNAENFSKALNEGSWQSWMSVSTVPQNDPHTVLLSSIDALYMEQDRAKSNAQSESLFNNGFLSMKNCVEEMTDEWSGEKYCTKYENTTPGKWISDQLSTATGMDFQELALADEINELVSALISQFVSIALQNGFKK